MAMDQMTIEKFIEELSGDAPVPGGGGASALVAAVGMSLGNMVMALTTGKKKYAQYQEEIEASIEKATGLTKRLLEGMDKDAEAFEPLSKAYGLPKDTPEQLEERTKIMEAALKDAAGAPLELMETIMEALKLLERIAAIGSKIAISDAGVAVQLCKAAMNGASLNVYINTKLMKDREVADAMNQRADRLVKDADASADATFELVAAQLRN
ncbi:MAG: cyclodeaminase/cyclohydrolase family protein [Lachnospiraceae bacterium]|nr:cyclodeaminase/cyclohydrolase family protein [Lachnospiraceae bacterium]